MNYLAGLVPDAVQDEMRSHAVSLPDKEVCGFVYPAHYAPLRNISAGMNRFEADPAEVARALSRWGEPLAVFHTHPNGIVRASRLDSQSYYRNHIIGVVNERTKDVSLSFYVVTPPQLEPEPAVQP